MKLGVDVRCLQDSWRTGVGEVCWRTLGALRTVAPDIAIAAYSSGRRRAPELPRGIACVHDAAPNRLNNLAYTLGLKNLDSSIGREAGKLDALWLPVPLFAHISGRVPAVLTVHDLSFIHYPDFFKVRGHLWYFPFVKRFLRTLPGSVYVAAVSQHTADDLLQVFPKLKGRVHVIPLGVGSEYTREAGAEQWHTVQKKYNLPERYLLSLGTIEPRKNYALLLAAYESLVRADPAFAYDLVIAGAWGWRTRAIKRQFERMHCRARVHVLGYVEESDKPTLYSKARLFLYPSHFEGFGLPALEAMAAGVPVIASATSSLPEVVGEAGLLLGPMQQDSWVQAMSWLARDENARQLYIRQGRERAAQFTWEKCAEQYARLFKALA